MSRLIITDDSEHFTQSQCDCLFCTETHNSVLNWRRFIPENSMEKRMKNVIDRIQLREENKIRHQKIVPKKLRRSSRLKSLNIL